MTWKACDVDAMDDWEYT